MEPSRDLISASSRRTPSGSARLGDAAGPELKLQAGSLSLARRACSLRVAEKHESLLLVKVKEEQESLLRQGNKGAGKLIQSG